MAFGLDDAVAAGLHIIDKFVPDPAEKQKAEESLRSYLAAADKAQTDVNTAEASNPNLFVAGWRPMIGWVCALALAYQYLVCPLGMWIATSLHLAVTTPPKLDDSLWQLMFGMLGMGGLRTFEKLKGVTK
jgi:hypothetical protein